MATRAVAFDLDYTLAVPVEDRATILERAVSQAGGTHLVDALSRDAYLDAHTREAGGETREPIFQALLDDAAVDGDPEALATAYRDEISASLAPVRGAQTLLETLRGTYELGLLTDGPGRAQRHKLETLGWTDHFDDVVVTGDLATRKPDPRTFEAILDGLGVPACETVYVGDHVDRDVVGAKRAGLTPIQVLGPGDDPVPEAAAHVYRDELAEALPMLLASLT